ncbi:MAG TPA: hypothetical protein VFW77_00855 [Candidatus Saccharimonadales bacterium]|nr:hypothetical protein [Candidatus Saccharimonadales bacterium]
MAQPTAAPAETREEKRQPSAPSVAETAKPREETETAIGMGILGLVKEDGSLNGKLVINGLATGRFTHKTFRLRDNPNLGFEPPVNDLVEDERAARMVGKIPTSVRIAMGEEGGEEPVISFVIEDIDRYGGERGYVRGGEISDYEGPVADLQWALMSEEAETA